MNKAVNDIELSQLLGETICEDYTTALEFLTINPDYSLLKFRVIVEALCCLIADKYALEFGSDKLFEQIEELHQGQLIDAVTKSIFHSLRKLCNSGVHITMAQTADDQNSVSEAQTRLKEKANEARNFVVQLFENLYITLKIGKSLPKIELVHYGTQEHREILYKAATSLSHQVKLKAGIIYESMAEDVYLTAPFLSSTDAAHHQNSLFQLAATHYKAAFKISAQIDKRVFEISNNSLTEDEIIYRYCDLESLFRYAFIARQGSLGENEIALGSKLLKLAARRGYSNAIAHYGAYLYEDKKFDEAFKYLALAAEQDMPIAYRFLYYYYSDNQAVEPDVSQALDYLNKAIELGCADSLGELGFAYFRGDIVEKDDEKAERMLLESIDKGSFIGKRHYYEFTDIVGKASTLLANKFKELGESMIEELDKMKPTPVRVSKSGRNRPCPCGSGIKHKRCCLNLANMKINCDIPRGGLLN